MDAATTTIAADVILIAVGAAGVLLHRWAAKPGRQAAEDVKREVSTIRSQVAPAEDGIPLYARLDSMHTDMRDGFARLNLWGESVDGQIGAMRADIGKLQRPNSNGKKAAARR